MSMHMIIKSLYPVGDLPFLMRDRIKQVIPKGDGYAKTRVWMLAMVVYMEAMHSRK